MKLDDMPELIGTVIFIVVIFTVALSIAFNSLTFLGDAFCGSTVMTKHVFNNLFIGWIGRAFIPDQFFSSIPLLCPVHSNLVQDNNIEQVLASEVINCYNRFGAGDLDGVFPAASRLCSVILYDVPIDDENVVDLMKVYELVANNSNFPSEYLGDSPELDYENAFRFCLNPEYQRNVYANMYNSDFTENSFFDYFNFETLSMPLVGVSSGGPLGIAGYIFQQLGDRINLASSLVGDNTGMCQGIFNDGILVGNNCSQGVSLNDAYYWMSSNVEVGEENSCFSLSEAALNNWQFDMSLAALSRDVNNNDLITLCSDLCERNCVMQTEGYFSYNDCYQTCEESCETDCERDSCIIDFTTEEDDYVFDFSTEITNLFSYYNGTSTVSLDEEGVGDFSTSTLLHRGTFYIRFFDYVDWLQQGTDNTWHSFPECDNSILLLKSGSFLEAIGITSTSIERKHDYVAICYQPLIKYEHLHPDEFGPVTDNVVVIS